MYTIIMQIKNIGHHARLREDDMYFAAEVSLREIFRCVRARANLRPLTTQKSCAVGMHNAILRNHLKKICLILILFQLTLT